MQAKLELQQRQRPKLAAREQPQSALRPLPWPPGASSPPEQPIPLTANPAQPSAAAAPARPAGGATELSGGKPAEGLGPDVCGTSGGDPDERAACTSAGVPSLDQPSGHKKRGAQQSARRESRAGHAFALRSGTDSEGLGVELESGAGSWQPDGGAGVADAAFAPKRGLKQRKKDFLKQRKLKKRGRAVSEAEAGDRLERRLLQDPQRPAFGEQALAPLKVRVLRGWGRARCDCYLPDEVREQLVLLLQGSHRPARGEQAPYASLGPSYKVSRVP